jgi:YggT family protein
MAGSAGVDETMGFFVSFLSILIQILIFAIFIRAIISWFPIDPRNSLVRVLDDITEPVLAPLRRVLPRLGMIDLTPMVAIIVLLIIQQGLASA